MKTIIRAIPERSDYVREYFDEIRALNPIMSIDFDSQGAMWNFYNALSLAGEDSALHMEDDIVITSDFVNKITSAINSRPNEVIQFFSMRQADIDYGSRYDRNFIMGQCFYLPKGYSKMILEYKWPGIVKDPTGLDLMVNDFLKSRKEKYWIHVPSLVNHRIGKSAINPRRSSKRQSKTFVL